ncbi:hypothetical protein EAW52_23725 [Pseudomonas sp. LTJR-52]|nr:hypothetical protein EAW52_23725 [Pseudomonas sp. LTJR-52]
MSQMADPYLTLTRFQLALQDRHVEVERGRVYPALMMHHDAPKPATARFTYALSECGAISWPKITAMAVYMTSNPIEREYCFNRGYAVHEE